ncbi:hypothetical protein MMC25_004969 [Agyrium rufum]|nr:hypothetical protein [Agyrium rufum]
MTRFTLAAAAALFTRFHTISALIIGRDPGVELLDSYDYLIVGCGTAGLVLANRLTEDPSLKVLCIEAGPADQYEEVIQFPIYVGSDIGGIYDWNLATVPQEQLDGAARPIPAGRVLGGGTILNGMVWQRGGQDDYNEWEALGNPGWGWAGILPYFQKCETYTPAEPASVEAEYSIQYDASVHGFTGPVAVSYPKYIYPQSLNFFQGLNLLGVPTEYDEAQATTAGAAFCPQDLDPINQTRSDARRAYYDPFQSRPNFHVLLGNQVTQILIEGQANNAAASNTSSGGNETGEGPSSGNNGGLGFGPGGGSPTPPSEMLVVAPSFQKRDVTNSSLRATGLEFAQNATSARQTIYATREVIVSAGVHSPQLLQLSGIGPAALLEQYNITVVLDLPGVGNNLQDHCLVGTFYPYNNASYPSPTDLTSNATYNMEAEQQYLTSKTGPWTAGAVDAIAFPSLAQISNRTVAILMNASQEDPFASLPPGLDATLLQGYAAQRTSLLQRLGQPTSTAYEIINNNAGSLTVSVMHPLSRGSIMINSADPFQPPTIDPRWLTDEVDRQVLVEALLFNRRILATPPMQLLQPAQFVPPIEATEDDINQTIDNGIRTEFHSSCTCAMLPLELGGVLDSHLRVWGTENLRVIDAQSMPMVPAAHLQSVVYALAEKGADIIKADNVQPQPVSSASSTLPTRILNTSDSTASSTSSVDPSSSISSQSRLSGKSTTSSSKRSSSTTATAKRSVTISSRSTSSRKPTSSISRATTASTVKSTSRKPTSTSSTSSSKRSTSTPKKPASFRTPSALTSATHTSLAPSIISSSIVAVLTSAGVPLSLATAIEPSLHQSASTASPSPSETGSPLSSLPAAEQAAIQSFIEWLRHIFHLD